MLRRTGRRWLDTQPRIVAVARPAFPTKPGSIGCDPTPATAAATRPPDGVVLVEAASAKIPPSLMQKATCFRGPIFKSSALATPPPKCDLDVDVHVGGSCLRPPPSLAAVPPSRWSDQGCTAPSSTSGDISLAGCLKEKEVPLPPGKDAAFSHPPIQRKKRFAIHGMDLISAQQPSTLSSKCTSSTHPSRDILCGHFYAEDRASMLSSEVGADPAPMQKCSSKIFSAQQVGGSMRPKMVQNWGRKMIAYCIPTRCFSTGQDDHKTPISPPLPPPDNLLEVVWPFTESETEPFSIGVVPAEDFTEAVKVDNAFVTHILGATSLEDMYHQKVRPALLIRGMVLPYQLHDHRTQLLHNGFKKLTKQYPIYMTSFDLMVDLLTTETNKWIPLLDDLSKKHIYVIEDWKNRFYTSSGYTVQDYGLRVGPDRGKGYYRGQCDAAYNRFTGLAKISAIIWLDNQIVCSAVCYGIPCRDSVHAEALAMSYLLKKGAEYKRMEIVSDCEVVINTIKGLKKVTSLDANYESFMLLRYLSTKYDELIPRLETREKLAFADSLLKAEVQSELTHEYVKGMLERWAPALRGSLIFMVGTHPPQAIKKLASNRIILEEFQNSCYCEVEKDSDKLSAVFHIMSALGANNTCLIVSDIESIPELEQQFIQIYGSWDIYPKNGRQYFLKVPRPPLHSFVEPMVPLFVFFNAADARDYLIDDQEVFVVVLSTPNERALMTKLNIEMFSPVSYVSFHRYTNANQKGLQVMEEQKNEEPSEPVSEQAASRTS